MQRDHCVAATYCRTPNISESVARRATLYPLVPACSSLSACVFVCTPPIHYTSYHTCISPRTFFLIHLLPKPQSQHPQHEGMAPDLNMLSQPARDEHSQPTRRTSLSARSGASSRRTSQLMGPPTVPASAAGPNHTTSDRVHMPHRVSSSHENDGPLRHPRPLTAAELYAECEKEQEAVVCTSFPLGRY